MPRTSTTTSTSTDRHSASSWPRFYPSAEQFLTAAQEAQPHPSRTRKIRHRSADEFFGNVTFDQAQQIARTSWREGREKVLSAASTLPAIQPASADDGEAPAYFYDVAGDELDVSRFLADEPEPFLCRAPREGEGKIIKIECSIFFTYYIPAAQIIRRGALICVVCHALEIAGYNVEISISATMQTKDGNQANLQAIIKTSDQPLELDRAAFFLAHPTASRFFIFSLFEEHPRCTTNFALSSRDILKKYHRAGETEIFLEAGNNYFHDDEDVLRPFVEAGLIAPLPA